MCGGGFEHRESTPLSPPVGVVALVERGVCQSVPLSVDGILQLKAGDARRSFFFGS